MKILVVGSGAIGFGSAALLAERGHDPVIWQKLRPLSAEIVLSSTGSVAGAFAMLAIADIGDALAGVDAVLITVPGYGHRAVMDAMAPHLRAGQVVVISSHCSMSALYLSKLLASRGVALPIIAWGTTVVTGRRTGEQSVSISNIRDQVDLAVLPQRDTASGLALCRELFGDRFVPRQDLLAIALSNVNPQNHLAMALCNFTRIEKGEDWGNYAGITESVGRLMEALDAERLAIADHFGREVRTVRQHFHLSFDVPLLSVAEMAALIDARGNAPPGPKTVQTRYVLEDIPFGIVATAQLADIAGVPAPLHQAGIAMFGAMYGRDFRRENNLLGELGLERLSPDALSRLMADGFGA